MKLVSRKVLESLLKSESLLKNSISEDESASVFSFQEFVEEYEKTIDSYARDRSQSRQTIFTSTYEHLKNNYLRNHCPPIEYCGEGSSRAAYACLGGKCLKVAMNERGIAQNKQEIKNLQNDGNDNPRYLCFTKLYEWDKKGSSLMTECCSKATDEDFKKTYGCLKFKWLYHVLDALKKDEFQIDETLKRLQREYKWIQDSQKESCDGSDEYMEKFFSDELDEAQWKIQAIENIEKSQAIEWKVLKELIQFYKDTKVEDLDVEDLANVENWGMAIREGKIVPVIIDAGLSLDIYDEYYA